MTPPCRERGIGKKDKLMHRCSLARFHRGWHKCFCGHRWKVDFKDYCCQATFDEAYRQEIENHRIKEPRVEKEPVSTKRGLDLDL